MEEEERLASTEVNSDSSDDTSSESDAELMVTSRARRSTAGNRYSTLVAQEEQAVEDDEDEVAMLFAEAEGEDEDFNSDEGDEEADMSSSDDDDQGPNVAAEDLEGEKQIHNEAKAERAKKRKADLALTTVAGIKKKPKIDPTGLRRASVPKPSKRKERVSWLPDSEATSGRTSLRKQTILHRAETHAKLKENEAQRLKMKAKREKRAREREAEAPKEMTQADRMAEAERVERRNAKSLNRWEAMEKKRAEEQAARLAALKERKLEGAVVTWYSTPAKYYGLKDNKDSEPEVPTEAKKRGRKPKALLEQLAAAKLAGSGPSVLAPRPAQAEAKSQTLSDQKLQPVTTTPSGVGATVVSTIPQMPAAIPAPDAETAASPKKEDEAGVVLTVSDLSENTFLNGIHDYATVPPTRQATQTDGLSMAVDDPPSGVSKDVAMLEILTEDSQAVTDMGKPQTIPEDQPPIKDVLRVTDAPSPQPTQITGNDVPKQTTIESGAVPNMQDTTQTSSATTAPGGPPKTNPESQSTEPSHVAVESSARKSSIASSTDNTQTLVPTTAIGTGPTSTTASAEPPIEVISTRNLVILDRFDDLSDSARYDFGLFYNNRKTAKPVKQSQELCPITGLTARYRDPDTGIGYANAAAYKKLQDIKSHKFTWSSMLGCYVGRANVVARGVPDGFLGS